MTYPWPFSNREWYIQVIGTCLTKEKAVIIVLKSIEGDEFMNRKVEKNESCVEIDVHYIGIKLEILEEEKIQVSFVMNIDPQMSNMP